MASVLVIGPHPDDQELGMGGTVIWENPNHADYRAGEK